MRIDLATPALLFPAVSLLFLSYSTRFLHLASLVRQLHQDWLNRGGEHLRKQIQNLRIRLWLIRWMQLSGALSLLMSVTSTLLVMMAYETFAFLSFGAAMFLMGISLCLLISEIALSGGALRILLEEIEDKTRT